ncbi:sulfite exporter TauE/SafE family protein [Neptunicella sp. SCSIO 80796]|uniref:sulfite exporter TauE/SafE family protein n=1 Tax=Neptunicella plasticusilytica TaxID=3117012 RepID=UPI003A4DC6F9
MAWIWIGFCIFFAFSVEAMTGFGSIVLALSLGALVMDIPTLVPLLVALNILMTAPLTLHYRQHIQFSILLKRVLPCMLIGTLLGVYLTPQVPATLAKLLFALLIIWFSARALLRKQAPPLNEIKRNMTMTAAGVTHGLFASGGPLLVYALARSQLGKMEFRATLLTVWLTLNSLLTCWFIWHGELQGQASRLLTLVPCVLAGAVVGNILHHKINEGLFLRLVFGLLLIVGLLLAATSIFNMLGSQA